MGYFQKYSTSRTDNVKYELNKHLRRILLQAMPHETINIVFSYHFVITCYDYNKH